MQHKIPTVVYKRQNTNIQNTKVQHTQYTMHDG